MRGATGGAKPLSRFVDPDHPFFARAWVRWATVLVPAAMAGVDGYFGNLAWAAGFGLIAAYAFWMLIVVGPGKGTGPQD